MPSRFASGLPEHPLGLRRAETFWNSLSHGCANRDSSVSSSFPSRLSLGGYLAPPVTSAKTQRHPCGG